MSRIRRLGAVCASVEAKAGLTMPRGAASVTLLVVIIAYRPRTSVDRLSRCAFAALTEVWMAADILVALPTYPDPCATAWLPAAVAIGQYLDASITGLALEVDIPDVSNPVAEALLHLRDQIRAAERRSHRAADDLLEHLGSLCGPTSSFKSLRLRDQPPLLADAAAARALS